ncbi:uncharacterized protein PGTG_21972 [Puccinia graminis f. sp. tritici CRL 75-36-700-3]|uniref:Uncharacterized protein n=1 Tax=Puccinia graminis f. sp. tritici (strain CRL 75-36-700-3 / race SCCL) TaxID=418459 RepID=H6QT14_PUCGT|nr:uncharacterized protein PGTG_21972 [Puccinia graminis f. sp. tritici CRL 75-36-700-3]EHS63968.1 hypothetical protein PGTG_21972 [Puccinia graminis f. sp. tritici CRL 75-36-700-3]
METDNPNSGPKSGRGGTNDAEVTNSLTPKIQQAQKGPSGRTIASAKKSRLSTIAEKNQSASNPDGEDSQDEEESNEDPTEVLGLLRAAPTKGNPKKGVTGQKRILEEIEDPSEEEEQAAILKKAMTAHCSDIDSLKKSLDRTVCGTLDTIQSIADCFQASELAIAQHSWRDIRLEIEEQHRYILEKLDRSTRLKRKSDHFVGQSVIQLARLSLPIFKLSKIFFAKLSERGLARERIPIHTEISSEQIDIIAESVNSVAERLHEIETFLDCANRRYGCSNQVIAAAETLKENFESPLFLVLLHFIPLIPDTEGLHRQKHYQDWCVTWNTHMSLAIHNFTLAAKSYTNARP